jgi:proteasome lid subunit RPN8/RPN11
MTRKQKNQSQQTNSKTTAESEHSLIPVRAEKERPTVMQLEDDTKPMLRFTPTAWAKLLYFRDCGETEIGGFGISNEEDLLLVEDFITVKQDVTIASVAFDDQAVADFFEDQVDAGRRPEQFGRIWLHTHPGNSPRPSGTDEETFRRVFGKCQWAVMFILAEKGKSYARLRFNTGPGGSVALPIEVDYGQAFAASDHDAWQAEYAANICGARCSYMDADWFGAEYGDDLDGVACPDDWMDELECMEPAERKLVLDELAARPDLWEDEEVAYAD